MLEDTENTWEIIKIFKAPEYLIINLKKLKLYSKKIPFIKYPTKNLDLSAYVINPNPIGDYKITPEEIYSLDDQEHHKKLKNELIFEKDENPNLLYDLYGVINHYGTQHFGHYTAYCQTQDGTWIDCDDSNITQIDENKVVAESAYLLFYKKKPKINNFN